MTEPSNIKHWNYQIIKHDGEFTWWGLHEVYKDDKGMPVTYTIDPIVTGDSPAEIWSALKTMLRDAQTKKILSQKDFENETDEDVEPT